MTKLAVAFAAAGILLAAPAFNTAAKAEPAAGVKMAQVSVEIGHKRQMHRDRRCRTTVVWRHGRKTVIKKCG